jgi:hypothetical protein
LGGRRNALDLLPWEALAGGLASHGGIPPGDAVAEETHERRRRLVGYAQAFLMLVVLLALLIMELYLDGMYK